MPSPARQRRAGIVTAVAAGTATITGTANDGSGVTATCVVTVEIGKTLAEATVGMIVGSNGKAYAVADKANLPSGVTAVAMVTYVGNASDCSHGLAIALEDVSSNKLTWDNSGSDHGSKTAAAWCSAWNTSKAVTGGTWRLPSIKDFNMK